MIVLLFLCLLSPDVESLSQAGAKAMREGRYSDAVRIYRQLAESERAAPQWRLNLGLALYSAGEFGEAIPEFLAYVAKLPAPGPGHWMLGASHLKLNRPCDAIAPLEIAGKWRSAADVLGPLADAYTGCKRYADAAATLEKLGEPLKAARAYWLARDYARARPLFSAHAAAKAGEPAFEYEFGDTLFRLEGAEKAIPHLERAQSILEARGMLGRAYVELGRFSDALPHLEAASKQNSNLLLPLSRCYREAGRQTEAQQALEQYRRLSQDASK